MMAYFIVEKNYITKEWEQHPKSNMDCVAYPVKPHINTPPPPPEKPFQISKLLLHLLRVHIRIWNLGIIRVIPVYHDWILSNFVNIPGMQAYMSPMFFTITSLDQTTRLQTGPVKSVSCYYVKKYFTPHKIKWRSTECLIKLA